MGLVFLIMAVLTATSLSGTSLWAFKNLCILSVN